MSIDGLQERCSECGAPKGGCSHSSKAKEVNEGQKGPELTKELLGRMKNLEIEVTGDFSPVLESMRLATGTDLQPRPEGLHVTVIGPTESGILKNLSDEDAAELVEINAQIQSGEGVTVKGIGFIDGADSQFKMREVDKTKKTSFVSLDIPRLAAFREKVGLPAKDFHVTLGFVEGDIHMQVVGEEEIKPGKIKEIKAPVPKKADSKFSGIQLPEMNFGGLSGELKPDKTAVLQAEVVPKKEKQQKTYDGEKLRVGLLELVAGGNAGGITAEKVDQIVELATTKPDMLGRELRADFRFVKSALEQSEK